MGSLIGVLGPQLWYWCTLWYEGIRLRVLEFREREREVGFVRNWPELHVVLRMTCKPKTSYSFTISHRQTK